MRRGYPLLHNLPTYGRSSVCNKPRKKKAKEGFGIVNTAETDVFLELSCFFDDPVDVGNLISGSSAFSKTSLNIWKFTGHILLKPGLDCVDHNKLWKILQEMGIADHLTCLLSNLYAGQEATTVPDMEQWAGSKSGREYIKVAHCQTAYLTSLQSIS